MNLKLQESFMTFTCFNLAINDIISAVCSLGISIGKRAKNIDRKDYVLDEYNIKPISLRIIACKISV